MARREFHSRTGMEHHEYSALADRWPAEREEEEVVSAARAALREVALGIRFDGEDEWSRWFSGSREEFRLLLRLIRSSSLN